MKPYNKEKERKINTLAVDISCFLVLVGVILLGYRVACTDGTEKIIMSVIFFIFLAAYIFFVTRIQSIIDMFG